MALETAGKLIEDEYPFNLNGISYKLENHIGLESAAERSDAPWNKRKVVHVFSAIEVACLDIIGKALGCPVMDLLGGRMRDRVPFAAYLFYKHDGAGI